MISEAPVHGDMDSMDANLNEFVGRDVQFLFGSPYPKSIFSKLKFYWGKLREKVTAG